MSIKHVKSLGCILSVVTALTLPLPSLAQGDDDDTARLPRPKVSSDAQYQLDRGGIDVGGYPIRIYFEESKTFTDLDAHVFYEPLVYLETDQHGALLRNVEDDGLLTLYFTVETDTGFLEGEIRKGLAREAQKRSSTEIVPGSFKYRISPLDLTAWFESSKRRLNGERMKSDELAGGSVNEKGRMPIYFETGSRKNAVAFVNELQNERDQLVFKYRFSGIADEICEAEFRGRVTQGIDLYKKVVGDGGEGLVTRHQAVDIADSMTSSVSLGVRCGNREWATWLTEELMKRVGAHEELPLSRGDGWERLDELLRFDSKSFEADLITEAKNIEKEVVREQVLGAISKGISRADTDARKAGVAIGYGGFVLGASGSLARSKADSVAEARKEFSDMMQKRGILGEWSGNIYIPKSVDVHSAADVQSAWGQDIDLKYVFTTGRTAEYSVNLTDQTFSATRDIGAELAERIEILKEELDKKIEELDRRNSALESSMVKANRLSRAAGAEAEAAKDRADRAESVAEAASKRSRRARERSKDAVDRADRALERMSGVRMETYKFHVGEHEYYWYNTGVSVEDYPAALATDLRLFGDCDTWNDYQAADPREKEGQWYIYLRTSDHSCEKADLTIFFFSDPLVDHWSRWLMPTIRSNFNEMIPRS